MHSKQNARARDEASSDMIHHYFNMSASNITKGRKLK